MAGRTRRCRFVAPATLLSFFIVQFRASTCSICRSREAPTFAGKRVLRCRTAVFRGSFRAQFIMYSSPAFLHTSAWGIIEHMRLRIVSVLSASAVPADASFSWPLKCKSMTLRFREDSNPAEFFSINQHQTERVCWDSAHGDTNGT